MLPPLNARGVGRTKARRRTSRFRRKMTAEPPAKAVVLVGYDETWPAKFAALRVVYSHALGDIALAIEHVGSTSVPGLVAKPVIDIDIVIESEAALAGVVATLSRLGYRHNGCQGVAGREVFKRDNQLDVPRDGSGRSWPAHNLYVCARGATELRRHIVFRDWLRSDAANATAYAALKRQLADALGHDRDLYSEAKTDFVEAAILEAEAEPRRPTSRCT
jgi:GrpB-like predicted nucleotidyltransferase (UPF0157 family)